MDYGITPEETVRNLARYNKKDSNIFERIMVTVAGVAVVGATILFSMPNSGDKIKDLPRAEYIIQPGDSYWKLSERFIDDKNKYDKSTITGIVAEINEKPADKLMPGDRIWLPVDAMDAVEVKSLDGMLQ